MMLAHVLIDDAENIITVHLGKSVDFDLGVYNMSSDIYEELLTLVRDLKNR